MARKRVTEPSDELQYRLDCDGPQALSDIALREKYHLSYSSFEGLRTKNANSRGQSACKVDQHWKGRQNFRPFLLEMGPRAHKSKSLDRLNPELKVYGPGLCRWATKKEQTRNRASTATITSPAGITKPVSEWAEELGFATYDQMMAWRRAGWPDAAILQGIAPDVDSSVVRPAIWSDTEETMYLQYSSQLPENQTAMSRMEFAIRMIENNLKRSPSLNELTRNLRTNFSNETSSVYIQRRWRDDRLNFYKQCLKQRDFAGAGLVKPVKLTVEQVKEIHDELWNDFELRQAM